MTQIHQPLQRLKSAALLNTNRDENTKRNGYKRCIIYIILFTCFYLPSQDNGREVVVYLNHQSADTEWH